MSFTPSTTSQKRSASRRHRHHPPMKESQPPSPILIPPSLPFRAHSKKWFREFVFGIFSLLLFSHALASRIFTPTTLMCLKKDPVLSFSTSRNFLIPSHTFTKSSTVLSFLPVLLPNCLQSSFGGVDLPYEIVWPYSNSLPYFSQMFNCTLIPSHTLPESSTVLSLGLVFL